jgi:hypothetical protein
MLRIWLTDDTENSKLSLNNIADKLITKLNHLHRTHLDTTFL